MIPSLSIHDHAYIRSAHIELRGDGLLRLPSRIQATDLENRFIVQLGSRVLFPLLFPFAVSSLLAHIERVI